MGAVFSYTARSAEGKFVTGTFDAENYDQALAHLRRRSLFVTSLSDASGSGWIVAWLLTLFPVSRGARAGFVRSLAMLTRAAVPLRRGLEIVTNGCGDIRLREALSAVGDDVESGASLSSAMERRPREFSALSVALIRAAEISGTLDLALERIATLYERENSARKRLGSALAYPAIVACAAFGLIVFLVYQTIPQFAQIFAELHVSLPLETRIVIFAGDGLRKPYAYEIGVFASLLFVGLVTVSRRTSQAKYATDKIVLCIPILGTIVRKTLLARFMRTLGALLQSGIPLLPALDVSRDVLKNRVYEHMAMEIASALRDGASIVESMQRSLMFDDFTLAFVRIGEETGSLDEMLLRIAEQYELGVEATTATLASVVEPIVIVVLGVIVGGIVASILIPLYSMIGSIK